MKNHWCIFLLLLLVFPSCEGNEPSLLWWTAGALTKVRPYDPPEASQSVQLYAARNEFEPFQIVLVSTQDMAGVDIEITDLVGPNGAIIPSATTAVYYETFLNLTTPSTKDAETGEWPDKLIPRTDRYTHEQRNAFPFELKAGRNQPLWIELVVPPGTEPGTYTGEARVLVDGLTAGAIPILLTVWAFELPSTSSLKTSYGFSGLSALKQHLGGYTNDDDLRAVTYAYQKAALMHRISIHGGSFTPPPFTLQDGVMEIDFTLYDAEVGPFLDGTVFGPGEPLAGARATTVDLRTHGGLDTDEKKVLYWRALVSHFVEREWIGRLFHYVWDEPAPKDLPHVHARALLAHEADPRIMNLLTAPLQPPLVGSIDIWTPVINCFESRPGFDDYCFPNVPREAYDAPEAGVKELWWYQACSSHGCFIIGGDYFRGWPSYMIDASAVANRIMPWLSWKYRIAGELYFNLDEAYSRDGDPAANIYLFGGNGDGTLFYPGRPAEIGGEIHIPLESIRLKLIREGLEDYEYLVQLARLDPDFTSRLVDRLVRQTYSFDSRPEALYAVRQELGNELEQRASRLPPEETENPPFGNHGSKLQQMYPQP